MDKFKVRYFWRAVAFWSLTIICEIYTYRHHLEKLLYELHVLLLNKNSHVAKVIENAKNEHRIAPYVLKGASKVPFPVMKDLNKLLLDSEIRAAFWKHMKFPTDLRLPTFSVSILYGVVSEPIHEPGFNAIFLPSNADQVMIDFCLVLAALNQVQVKLFNAEAAVAGGKALDINS